ncbi:checkpoint serine/threonine-protein kinase BUB1 [Hermetia illucens]|uniref:checkpoint serine/threonine-protein kinase BUB1 n=1 Tax=Hermetia illucens TaxID=343691 RepID=UPI0018CC73C4|nr:checkpoint serine/threonine-protein kinase BUB1 [Hermetia illucens]XP_037923203.1 checkpoint serine/threonine-protein kinase BUB1 [Hermetia illucens]XP_037923204.1 checkpoint serine/threonine-protein kinase BUB1 [Hermetia illucens]XP_037923205.1 checkpoint serine/threonine-protein kinase BUB1 [Hermetia illucens]
MMNTQMHSNDQSAMFLRDKGAWENAIAAYSGPDPLELWYNYICWYDYNMRVDPENKFREALEKCLTLFEHNELYKQDVRMIKLWVKYLDLQTNPLNLYQILYQRGVGTRCSCFYIGWAHYYDSANAFKQAESVYNLGFQAKAEPYDELQEAHTKFRLSLSHRMLYTDNSSKKRTANHLIEQRQQITTLNPSKRIKTDAPETTAGSPSCNNSFSESQVQQTPQVQQQNQTQTQPVQVHQNHSHTQQIPQHPGYSQAQQSYQSYSQTPQNNQQQYVPATETSQAYVQVQQSQSQNYTQTQQVNHQSQPSPGQQFQNNVQTPQGTPVQHQQATPVQSQAAHQTVNTYTHVESDQCNLKNSAYVISSSLNYIYNDTQDDAQQMIEYPLENVKLPQNFVRFSKNNHESWKPLLCLEEPFDPNRRCVYRKDLVYPGGGIEFSPEEIRARKWAKKLQELRYSKMTQQQMQPQQQMSVPATSSHNTHKPAKVQQTHYEHQYNHQPANNTVYGRELEEQIEASTIRFSSDTGTGTKNKTITIKFKRDKSAPNSNSFSSSVSIGESYGTSAAEQSYTGEEKHYQSYEQNNEGFHSNGEVYYVDSKESNNYSYQQMPTNSTPVQKVKKVKKVKIVNKYDDSRKYSATSVNNNTSEHVSSRKSQYDDANLLLSIANMHSSEARSSDNANISTATNETLTCNDDSLSNTDFNSTYSESPYPNRSNCSTPVRKLSQSYSSKASTPLYRSLKRHTSNLSVQNDDSMCSYEQNSFFATENNDDLKQKRLDKALATIDTHLAKQAIDPFNSELCKAFLTKIDFPSRDVNETYKVVNTPIPKLANVKVTSLADVPYSIEKEVGRGSYGSVYKATNMNTGQVVALKYQKPPNIWEIYICTEVCKRITNYDILSGFMDLSSAIIAPNASILVTEFSPYGSLLDINNKIRQSTKKVMHESLVMHFSSQILNVVSHLHSCQIIHADIKPDNFLLMKVPCSDSHIPSLRLIDFGCAIDMTLFPERTEFKKVIQTDGFTCIEMQEGRHWSYQTDYFCVAGTVHVMLFGEYMQVVKKFGAWDIKQKLPRYLKKHVWTDFFTKMLNIKDVDRLPDLMDMKSNMDDEASKMDSELQTQIRTLSNLLHRR